MAFPCENSAWMGEKRTTIGSFGYPLVLIEAIVRYNSVERGEKTVIIILMLI